MAASEVLKDCPKLHLACDLTASICLAIVGYNAQDKSGRPPPAPRLYTGILLAAVCIGACGCRVGGLGVTVRSPTFGSVAIELDGGLIGKGVLPKPAREPPASK